MYRAICLQLLCQCLCIKCRDETKKKSSLYENTVKLCENQMARVRGTHLTCTRWQWQVKKKDILGTISNLALLQSQWSSLPPWSQYCLTNYWKSSSDHPTLTWNNFCLAATLFSTCLQVLLEKGRADTCLRVWETTTIMNQAACQR